MARPRSDSSKPQALERLHEAFWESLEFHHYQEITVAEIARRAQVNKNTFYYHFKNMDELAKNAIESSLLLDIADIIMGPDFEGILTTDGLQQKFKQLPSVATKQENLKRWRHLRLIAGPHGTNELTSYVKQMILDVWIERTHIDFEKLDLSSRITVYFALSGLIGVVSGDFVHKDEEDILMREMLQSRAVRCMMSAVFPILAGSGLNQESVDVLLDC